MNRLPAGKFEEILESLKNPSSYLGLELNSRRKERSGLDCSIALLFPDVYNIGMSHLGLKILYNIINSEPGLAAERAFAPDEDFAAALRREGVPLMSLETKTPLAEFDIVGFTIPYELSYTNMLWILDLARIPMRAADREDSHPLVIGGGAGVYNPEPIAEFFDLFVLGDGERVVIEIMRETTAAKGAAREDLLKRLARIPGVYVPSFFDASYHPGGEFKGMAPKFSGYDSVKRVFLPALDDSPYPFEMVVPFGSPTQDRLNVEIDRGCTQGCRFCQAGTTYRPVRERTPGQVLEIMEKALERTGYEGISVTSLSAGDYSRIGQLLRLLMDRYSDDRISLSLPSLRSGTVTGEIIEQVSRGGRSGFTITAEAGSGRLREVINKKVTDQEIMDVASRLLAAGWRSLKLYFMIGLPTETDDDIDSIYYLCSKLANLKHGARRFANISVSVSNFVPKAHTAFQWFGQNSIEQLEAKKERLFSMIRKNRRLRLKWHDPRMSHMEAVFSRGDRRLADVIESAYRMGSRMDSWTERFDFGRWARAFEENGLDSAFYANRRLDTKAPLPWDHIDTGLSKKYLLREWKHALKGEVTDDCRTGDCLGCGLDPKTCFEPYEWAVPEIDRKKAASHAEKRFKYRFTFSKTGLSRFFSHLELISIITRALRMAGAPLRYSQGFSPHPKISFGYALPMGVESAKEMFDVELRERWSLADAPAAINKNLPAGLCVHGCEEIPAGSRSVSASVSGFEYLIELKNNPARKKIMDAVEKFNAADSVIVERAGGKKKRVDTRKVIEDLKLDEQGALRFRIKVAPGGTTKPHDLLKALFPNGEIKPARILKLSNIMKND